MIDIQEHGIGAGKKLVGDAQPGDVRAGKTFSNTDGNDKVGTLPVQATSPQTINPGTANIVKPAGIYDGAITVQGDADLTAANIKAGVNIFGVIGTAPIPAGTAVAADVLTGKTFSSGAGTNISGSMPNQGAVTITPGNVDQAIAAGHHNGNGKVAAVVVDPTKVLTGTTIAGTAGTMVNRGAVAETITTQGGTYTPRAGYHNGAGTVTANISNLVASNIKKDVNVGGIIGTLTSIAPSVPGWRNVKLSSAPRYLAAGKTVVFVERDGTIDAVDAATGSTLWSYSRPNVPSTLFADPDSDIVAYTWQQGTNMYGLKNGAVAWSSPVTGSPYDYSLGNGAVFGGFIYQMGKTTNTGSGDTKLYKININTGVKSVLGTPGTAYYQESFISDPYADASGNVYFKHYAYDGYTLKKLNSAGTLQWSVSFPQSAAVVYVDATYVYVLDIDGSGYSCISRYNVNTGVKMDSQAINGIVESTRGIGTLVQRFNNGKMLIDFRYLNSANTNLDLLSGTVLYDIIGRKIVWEATPFFSKKLNANGEVAMSNAGYFVLYKPGTTGTMNGYAGVYKATDV